MVWAQDEIMADELQPHNHKQLFHELKKRFPEVPDNIVSILMRDNHFVREHCIDALGRESKKYLSSETLTGELNALHVAGLPERQASSSSGSGGDILVQRTDSDNHHGIANAGVGTISTRNHSQSNNASGSANTTPSNEVDVLAMYAANGPFAPSYTYARDSHGPSSGLVDTAGGWPYSPQGSQGYPTGGGTSVRSQGGYAAQPQLSGPTSLPQGHYNHGYHHQQAWGTYDPRHTTPTSTHRFPQQGGTIRTPSPQHYPVPYPFDYSQYNQPGSPNTGRTTYYTGMEPTSITHTSPYNPSTLGYIPPKSTPPGTVPVTSSPSSVPPMWYQGGPTTPGSGGSNASTPTHPYSGVYTPGGSWRPLPEPAPEPETSIGNMKLPVGVNGPPLPNGRRGSEDTAYTQALMIHQNARMEKLRHDLETGYLALKQLEAEVVSLENCALERKNQRSSTFPTGEDVGKMRDENRRLLIDIQLMTREIDVVNNGQTPLGVIDTEQNFYKNMASTGQRGSIHAGGDDGFGRVSEPLHNSRERVPPARPPPPATSNMSVVVHGPPVVSVPTPLPPDPDDVPNWNCSACTFLNHPLMDRCEFCEMPRICPAIQGSQDYR